MLATAEFVALPMPEGCDVPVGALNHTGVMSKRNELTRFATPYLLTQSGRGLQWRRRRATYLLTPASYHRTGLLKLKKYQTLQVKIAQLRGNSGQKFSLSVRPGMMPGRDEVCEIDRTWRCWP